MSLERLRRIAETPWEKYSVDEDLQALAERHLHILLESILDLAAFIAARRGLPRGPTYRDVARAVVDAGMIPRRLAKPANAGSSGGCGWRGGWCSGIRWTPGI